MRHKLQLALLLGLSIAAGSARPDERAVHGVIPFTAASVDSADGRVFTVAWTAPGIRHVRIFAGTSSADVGPWQPIGEGDGTGKLTVSNLPSAPRWYFRLLPNHGDPLVTADRSLHLTTAANFRDAGGYRTTDGKWVRMGLVYRSNGLEHLTDQELAQIDELHIKLVCDLRTAEEVHRGPDRAPTGSADVSADVLADDADLIHGMIAGTTKIPTGDSRVSSVPAAAAPGETMDQKIYRDFVRLRSAQKAYGSLFERLADAAELPTVFHCTAGKDRTGWAEAIFLTILGVPHSTIIQDYLLTNRYLTGEALNSVGRSMNQVAVRKVVADPAALDTAFDQVRREYGSFDAYLRDGLLLSSDTIETIKRNFLAD
jgi:protein-tyrosine phosphatase